MIGYSELESRARLVYDKVEHTEVCSIGFWFLNGSVDENKEQKGYAHFIEHILFKGTQNKTTSEIARCFDRIGSNFNAFTEKETTCFYCTFPSKHIEYAINLLSEIIFSPLFEKSEIQKEKNVIISEIHEYEELPDENSYDLFLKKMWHPYSLGYKITGEIKDVKKIKRDSLFDFYADRYTPEKLILAVAGNFDIKKTIDLFNRALPQKKKQAAFVPARIKPESKYSFKYHHSPIKQIHINTGIAFPTSAEMKTYYILLFFSTLAGESMSSRLFQKLREESGLCYSIYSYRSIFTHSSMWNIYANTLPDIYHDFMTKLNTELSGFLLDKFKKSEIEDARTHLEGGLILSQEDMELRMKRLARHYIFNGRSYSFEDSLEILYSVSLNDIYDFINRYFLNKKFNTLIYGNIQMINCKKYDIMIKG
ncbi:MAG: insulinase family protein [Spirochaetes bacterium]|nr:insulinase family protein [Spirochaetota bacterium]